MKYKLFFIGFCDVWWDFVTHLAYIFGVRIAIYPP